MFVSLTEMRSGFSTHFDFLHYQMYLSLTALLFIFKRDFNGACQQHSHNAIYHWNFQKYSAKIIYTIID